MPAGDGCGGSQIRDFDTWSSVNFKSLSHRSPRGRGRGEVVKILDFFIDFRPVWFQVSPEERKKKKDG